MAVGTSPVESLLHGRKHQSGSSAARSVLAMSVLAAGIVLTVLWIGTLGWFSLHIPGWL